MTACGPEPVWTAAHVWACACGQAHDHSGRRTINAQHAAHIEHTGPEHDRVHMFGSHEATCHRCALPGQPQTIPDTTTKETR